MKKQLLLTRMLLLVALLVGSVSAWGQAAANTVLWSEDWTGSTTANSGSNSATPSANYGHGTTVYGSGTVTYTQSANSVYVRNEEYAGGEKPELMLSSGNTWTISNIPTGGAVDLTLTYKSNNAKSSVTCSTSGTSVSGSSTSYTITTGGAETITLVFGCSGNTRIDDISLTVKTAGASKTNVGTFSTISDQAVTKGSSIDFDPSDYYTDDAGVTGTTTFTVTPTSGDIYYSESKHAIMCGNNSLGLTEMEMDFMKYMLGRPEEAISREDFLDSVWGLDAETESRVVDETVRRLRRKLRAIESKVTINTVWGFGYQLGVVE